MALRSLAAPSALRCAWPAPCGQGGQAEEGPDRYHEGSLQLLCSMHNLAAWGGGQGGLHGACCIAWLLLSLARRHTMPA